MKNIQKIKYVLPIILCCLVTRSFSQASFNVRDFSENYYGVVEIEDTNEVFSRGSITIFEKVTEKQLIKVVADELYLDLEADEPVANIKELPYGRQSLIMYEDFNFDGIKDFAIEDGHNSCYNGPSFTVYLAEGNEFEANADFTKLAHDYCGMFDVDHDTRTISTMTKDGCCWHQFSMFIVENNKPRAVKIAESNDWDSPYNVYSEEKWDGEKMVKSTPIKTLDLEQEGIEVVFSFTAKKNGKRIVLFNVRNETMIRNETLNYALLHEDNVVEFSYPIEVKDKSLDFKYKKSSNALTFKNQDATYKIYSDKKGFGIEISVAGKKYNWIGDVETKKGNLKNLLKIQSNNLLIVD